MRATMNILMRTKNFRSAIFSAAAFAMIATVMTACGELTGPTSPSTPTDVHATLATATSATITWTPSPKNDGVISYSIYRNNSKVGESTTTSFTDTGLAQQTTYVYSVAANCKSGVISDRSAETAASTVTTVDITPPTVIATSPANGATGVSRAGTSTVTFSEPMDPNTINTSTFTMKVTSTGAAIAGTVKYTAATRVAEFTPTSTLPNSTSITVTVTTGAKDLAGNALAAPFTAARTTRDEDPPFVISSVPVPGATGVAPSTAPSATFNEPVDNSTTNPTNVTLKVTATGAAVAGQISYNASTRTVTYTPSLLLTQGTSYTFTVNGIKDASGNVMTVPYVVTFTVGDVTAPTVTATTPADQATGVATNSTVTATFSEPMDQATITATTFTLRPTAGGANLAGTVAYNNSTNTATFTPNAALTQGTSYTATISTGAKDLAGNPLAAAKTWSFTTVDTTPPIVASVLPGNNATGITTGTTVQVTFNEPMDATTITAANITLKNTGTGVAVAATVAYNTATNVATLTPTGPLSNSTQYTVTVTTAVKDVSGNSLAAPFVSTFMTVGLPDNTAPTVVGRTPTPGATNVATNTQVTVTFSEAMDQTTINATNVKLVATTGGATVPTTLAYNAATNTVTLTPTAALANNTSYTITVTTGVKDLAGNALAVQFTSSFITVADTISPTVVSTSPANGTTVPAPGTITVTFSEDMDPTTIPAAVSVKKTSDSSPVAGTVSYNAATRTAVFTPTSALANGTGYTVTVATSAKDLAGNGLAGSFAFSFNTSP